MRPNPTREKWAAGDLCLGGWLSIPSPVTAEVMATTGFDYCCIDMQHGFGDFSDLVPMFQAITTGRATPFVRVPENLPSHIGKALDAGAMGVIVPMVNSVEECEAAVAAGRYPPRGTRSFGPSRVGAVEGPDYWERANREVAIVPMIETVAALESLDDILQVDGVEAIYVGPADLSISLGFRPSSEEPALQEALDLTVAACNRHGVVPGMHTTTGLARDRIKRGFRMLTITGDLPALRAKLADDLELVQGPNAGTEGAIY